MLDKEMLTPLPAQPSSALQRNNNRGLFHALLAFLRNPGYKSKIIDIAALA
jgi:hypothetical protein